MAPLVLEGGTLGKRHQHFNKLVNEAISHKLPFESIRSLEEQSDIDRLFKIDLAANCRDVEYILETLKSEDMLYVSRAIKQTPWLITDTQYAHIVNPLYLNDHLFPLMTSKAKCKFLLQVRLHLKQESRVEEFFKYYEDKKDIDTALKWLPHCSQTIIDKAVEKYCNDISLNLFKKLCEKHFSVLVIFCDKYQSNYKRADYLKSVMFLMHVNAEKYIDLLEKGPNSNYRFPSFGSKYTELIMKKCPERITNNFSLYASKIDIATFAKYLGKNNIKDFLLKQGKNEKLRSWFRYENIKPFIKLMPKEGKFEFLKQVFIDKQENQDTADDEVSPPLGMCAEGMAYKCSMSVSNPNSSSRSIYQWYRHASFDVALPELKKLIRTESSPDERVAIMAVMLSCAGANMKHIETVLQYYHDRHINEPFKYKVQFINSVITTTKTHSYDQKSWKILDELFHSMDVYIESVNNVQNCVEAVILYKLVHDEPIPEIIEKKFIFNAFQKKKNKLEDEHKQKLFSYLYESLEKKINTQAITNQNEFDTNVKLINQMIDLLIVWKKNIVEHPNVLNLMKALAKLKKEKSWTDSLMINSFYENKSWRKHLFEESLVLLPSQEVCMNALKHDPQLLKRYSEEVDNVRFNDNVSLTQFLNKLKIYWAGAESLAEEWIAAYRARLQQPGGHKAVARALTTLLTAQHLLDLIKQYSPVNTKIVWSEADELQLSLQKQIAMNMHIARPQPSPDAVLLYAKGDYLQYALPSLTAIFYNMSSARSRDHIPKLIDAPVSIQKHGIRLAFQKLQWTETKQMFSEVWKTTKNASVRAIIFALTIKLMSKESDSEKIEQLWQLLVVFIDNLTDEENKTVYNLLGDIDSLPHSIKGKFLMKSYTFLKALPAKLDCENLVQRLAIQSGNLMDVIDPDFVKGILLEYIDNLFVKTKNFKSDFNLSDVVASYILEGRTEEVQQRRYEEVLLPLMRHCFNRWDEIQDQRYVIKSFLCDQLELFGRQMRLKVFTDNFLMPVKLYKLILKELETSLSPIENYLLWRTYKLKIDFIVCLDSVRQKEKDNDQMETDGETDTNLQWTQLCLKVVPDFGKHVVDALKQDMDNYFPSIYDPFAISLSRVFSEICLDDKFKYSLYEIILSNKDNVECYLAVLSQMSPYSYIDDQYKADIKKLHELFKNHPSNEVKIHYHKLFDKYVIT